MKTWNLEKPVRPAELQAIHEQQGQVAKEYNEAVKSGNKELGTELRVKLNDLRKQAHQGGITHSIAKAGDFFELWIEIHNDTNNRILYNEGNWDVDDGWFESAAVGDIHPGDTAYIHIGGSGFSGISSRTFNCKEIIAWHGSSGGMARLTGRLRAP